MMFQRLIWVSLAVAFLVGLVQTGVQQLQAVPIILAAEVYEDQKVEPPEPAAAVAAPHAHAGHEHKALHEEAEAWAPEDGAQRIFWTAVANVLHAFSMSLLVFVVMGVARVRGATLGVWPLALLTAAAGWLTFHFWPSLGLHAEIPGMDAARLGSRQGWWALAALSAAGACAVAAALRSPWRWLVAAALLALPHVVGAPHIVVDPLAGFQVEVQAVLRDLGQQFIWATTWVSIAFWACMGMAAGVAFPRWVQPTLARALGARGQAAQAA
jgi:cobalt transporter subunit CbtA